VRLLGHPGRLAFQQAGGALEISVPAQLPSRHASVFRIRFA
jgi:alpha-L-fucosidase